jgi:hypothetical protein
MTYQCDEDNKTETSQSTLSHATAYCPETSVDLPWWRAKDKRDDGIPGYFNVLE